MDTNSITETQNIIVAARNTHNSPELHSRDTKYHSGCTKRTKVVTIFDTPPQNTQKLSPNQRYITNRAKIQQYADKTACNILKRSKGSSTAHKNWRLHGQQILAQNNRFNGNITKIKYPKTYANDIVRWRLQNNITSNKTKRTSQPTGLAHSEITL